MASRAGPCGWAGSDPPKDKIFDNPKAAMRQERGGGGDRPPGTMMVVYSLARETKGVRMAGEKKKHRTCYDGQCTCVGVGVGEGTLLLPLEHSRCPVVCHHPTQLLCGDLVMRAKLSRTLALSFLCRCCWIELCCLVPPCLSPLFFSIIGVSSIIFLFLLMPSPRLAVCH